MDFLGRSGPIAERKAAANLAETELPRRGRPPLPRDEARSERVVTFVTPGQLEALRGIAAQDECSVSAVVHDLLSSSLSEQDPGSRV